MKQTYLSHMANLSRRLTCALVEANRGRRSMASGAWLLVTWSLVFQADLWAQRGSDSRAWEEYSTAPSGSMEEIAVPSSRLTNGPHVRAAFRQIVLSARPSTVKIRAGGKDLALGGIVGADGWVLTKASVLKGPVSCRLADGREFEARLVGVSREYDTAMLKIEARGLKALMIADIPVPPVGSWVASVGMSRDPVAVGVVSVAPREIPPRAGILGIQLDAKLQRPRVLRVFPRTGAAEAGLLVDDEVLSVGGKRTATRDELIRSIQSYNPGDVVELEVKRGEEKFQLEAYLTGDVPDFPVSREEFQNSLGGILSNRRFGFPSAFQHDSVLQANQCGGPILDLGGNVVGFNIARSGRTETFALTTESLTKLLYELMSGNLQPEEETLPAEPIQTSTSP